MLLPAAPALHAAIPWQQNLLVNGSGSATLTQGWTPILNGGSGWSWSATGGLDETPGFFQTSYGWCTRSQTVDLIAAGATAAELDTAPIIKIGELVNCEAQNGTEDRYYVKVELRGENQEVLASWTDGTGDGSGTPVGSGTVMVEHEFAGYGAGVRYVYFEDGGFDVGFWAGHYGTRHDGAYVKLFNPELALDEDADGMPDAWEKANGLDFTVDDSLDDADTDTLFNVDEYKAGTDPQKKDTDGDGLPDSWEYLNGTQGAVADASVDPDGDGLTNLTEFEASLLPANWDTDLDGVSDSAEIRLGTDPLDSGSFPEFVFEPVLKENFDEPGLNSVFHFQKILGDYDAGLLDTEQEFVNLAARITTNIGDSRNVLVFDQVDARADAVRLTFDYRMNTDAMGEAADGFGFGLFLSSLWGATGDLTYDQIAGIPWENPASGPGLPEAIYAGFDVYGGVSENDLRVTGPDQPTVPVGDVADIELRDGFQLNGGVFHQVIITAVSAGPDATSVRVEIIPDVYGGGGALLAIPNVLVKGFDLRGELFRLAAGGRTGGSTVITDIDNILLEAAGRVTTPVEPAPMSITAFTVSATAVSLSWTSSPGATYKVEYSGNLQEWLTAATDLPSGGATTSYTHTLPANSGRLFYRVERLP